MEKLKYGACIPPIVRQDKRLGFAEMVMFAEIRSLSQEVGYCDKPNEYFAELYGQTINRVKILIRRLKKYGYIKVKSKHVKGLKGIMERKIYITQQAYVEDIKC